MIIKSTFFLIAGKLENGGKQKEKEILRIPHPEARAVDILIQIHPDIFTVYLHVLFMNTQTYLVRLT